MLSASFKRPLPPHLAKINPLGVSDFEVLRKSNMIYVDKTACLASLANSSKKVFIARPRRFGKSLLLSTLKSLFSNGLKYFKGLAIESSWNDKTYPVIRMDFSILATFESPEDFALQLNDYLVSSFKPIGFTPDPNDPNIVGQLNEHLSRADTSSIVLLIDEYDSPLTSCLHDSETFEKTRNCLAKFFEVVKSQDSVWRFAFMTGITKINKTQIFSQLNNFDDITLQTTYSSLIGYTGEELQKYFHDFFNYASEVTGLSTQEIARQLKSNYDGYCFDTNLSEFIYSPWSVLKYLTYPADGFRNYWVESGGQPSILRNYLKSHSLKHPEEYEKLKPVRLDVLNASADPKTVSDTVILAQTGYLTIKDVKGGVCLMGYPNEEVASSMAALYTENLLGGKLPYELNIDGIESALERGDADLLVEKINNMFAGIDYTNYPVRDESTARAFVQVLLSDRGLFPQTEVHNAYGRADLLVESAANRWVFEFKYISGTSSKAALSRKLKQALQQMEEKQYGKQNLNGKELIRMALIFSAETKSIAAWKLLPNN